MSEVGHAMTPMTGAESYLYYLADVRLSFMVACCISVWFVSAACASGLSVLMSLRLAQYKNCIVQVILLL